MTTLLNLLAVLILFQLGIMALFLFTSNRGKKTSNRLLAGFFLLLLINVSDGLAAYKGLYVEHPGWAQWDEGFVFLFGPVLWLYTQSMVYNNFRLARRHLLHAIPFLLVTIAYQAAYHTQSEEQQKFIQDAIMNQTLPPGFYFTVVIVYAHVITYLALSLRLVGGYRIQIREQFSAVGEINLSWLSFMLFSIAGILIVSSVYTFLPTVGLRQWLPLVFLAAIVFLFVFTSIVTWKGLRQPELFLGLDGPAEDGIRERRYSQPLNDSERSHIVERLQKCMSESKPYLQPDLSLEQLAGMVNTTPKRLSQYINDSLGQNFFDYINSHRIEEAKRIFQETTDPRITVLEVMYQCGFNSKSSFNTLFRQKTGLTPSAFKKEAKPSS